MAEMTRGDLRSAVDAVRQIVTEWDALMGSIEDLTRNHEQLRAHCETVERDYRELREVHDRLRRAHEERARALTELRSAHEALLRSRRTNDRRGEERVAEVVGMRVPGRLVHGSPTRCA